MNRKILRIFLICMIVVMFFLRFNILESFANQGSEITSVFDGVSSEDYLSDSEDIIEKIIGTVLSAVRIVATGISLIMLTYLGIKYMSAAPTEKASIKNQLVAFVVGAGVVFGATAILEFAVTAAQSIF